MPALLALSCCILTLACSQSQACTRKASLSSYTELPQSWRAQPRAHPLHVQSSVPGSPFLGCQAAACSDPPRCHTYVKGEEAVKQSSAGHWGLHRTCHSSSRLPRVTTFCKAHPLSSAVHPYADNPGTKHTPLTTREKLV